MFFAVSQVRATDHELAGGHASGHTHGSRSGRRSGPETVAVRRLLEGRGVGEQNGEQRNARVRNSRDEREKLLCPQLTLPFLYRLLKKAFDLVD